MGPHQDALLVAPAPAHRHVASPLDLPVARVVLDLSLPHLDRLFDYLVPPELDAAAQPGTAVIVRFGDKEAHGWVWERTATTTHPGRLAPLRRVISDLVVLPERSRTLVEAVAARTAGMRADVVRLAVPARHARAEKAERERTEPSWPVYAGAGGSGWLVYDGGADFLTTLGAGGAPRVVCPVLPARAATPEPAPESVPAPVAGETTQEAAGVGGAAGRKAMTGAAGSPAGAVGAGWPELLTQAARVTLAGGRSVLAVVATTAQAERLAAHLGRELAGEPVAVLSAELGPAARYRQFTAILAGHVRVVVGTRAAAFAPLRNLGLAALWDDGDDRLDEPRAPYVHARTVLALRSSLEGCGLLLAGYTVTVEAANYLAQGWAHLLQAPRRAVREVVARVEVPGAPELEREGESGRARIPSLVHQALREGLRHGPVLVQVPRGGYAPVVACQHCRQPAACPRCSGPVRLGRGGIITCRWCGRQAAGWVCPRCEGRHLRMLSVGTLRTGEELGRAFPGVPVAVSGARSDHGVIDRVDASPRLVVATPGAEPVAEGGYQAVALLDGAVLSARPELGAASEAMRRWAAAVALAAPHSRVILLGGPDPVAAQALVRWDQAGFARRELEERADLHLPPAWRCARLDGPARAVQILAEQATAQGWEVLTARVPPTGAGSASGGTGQGGDGGEPRPASLTESIPGQAGDRARALVRVPSAEGGRLAAWLRVRQRERSARREEPVRVELDPTVLW